MLYAVYITYELIVSIGERELIGGLLFRLLVILWVLF